jgi:hypothetical protein
MIDGNRRWCATRAGVIALAIAMGVGPSFFVPLFIFPWEMSA